MEKAISKDSIPLLSVALNGSRSSNEHPRIPRSPWDLAKEARAAVEGGARIVHLHAYDASGVETLAAEPCAAALRAVRAACPGLSRDLMRLGLIDVYRLRVNPVILGHGIPLFQGLEDKINLKLVNSKTFDSGVVALHYETQRAEK